MKRRALASVTVVLLSSIAVATSGHSARAATVETPSWGAANLLSANDSDFEAGVAGWAAVSNTTVSHDIAESFHGTGSMKMVATAAGTQVAKAQMGGNQMNLSAGHTYRQSAWMKMTTAASGRTVTFAEGFYDSAGTWLGWTSGTAVTLANTTDWQYVSSLITPPTGADHVLGSPRITETGVSAGERLVVDEVVTAPYRAATIIGAKDPSTDASNFSTTNTSIGPLQGDKLFYSTTLPSSYSSSTCNNLPSTVTCVIAYKTQDTNVASFVSSIPAGNNTVIVYYQEPEGHYTSGSTFVSEFEGQSNLIRNNVTSSNRANVWVADDSDSWQYGDGRAGADCSYTVPSSYVDLYLDDHYENPASGNNVQVNDPLTGSGQKSGFNNWIGCVGPQNKPIGFAEYGLDCPTTNTPNQKPQVPDAMSADETLLKGESFTDKGGTSYTRPAAMWMYWYYNNNGGLCQFTDSSIISTWQGIETANGGGAN